MTSAVPGVVSTPPQGIVSTPETRLVKADKILESLRERVTTPGEIEFLKVLVYCRTGLGKTWFGASAPKPCFYDVDGTTVSLQQNPAYSDIPVIPYVSEYQGEMLIEKIAANQWWEDRQTFVFDSATMFQNKSLKSQIRTQLGIRSGNETESMLTRYLSGDMDWVANTQYMEDVVARLDKIKGKHVIVTCHVKSEKDTSSGIDRWLLRPDITNKAYQSFSRWANVIGYIDVIGEKRTMRILPSPTIDAKSHIGGPPLIENPTFQSLLDIKEKKS
jgi:hypothetical protein